MGKFMVKMVQRKGRERPEKVPLGELIRQRPVTAALIGANVAIWFIFGGAFQDPLLGTHIDPNFLLSADTLAARPWTFVTAAFMHVGLIHLAMNMWALWSLAGYNRDGPDLCLPFLGVYGVSILASSAMVVLFSDPSRPTVGASGAIFGLLGLFLTHRNYHFGLHLGILVTVVVNMAISFTLPMVSWQAHLGGLVCGALLGLAMNLRTYLKLSHHEDMRWLHLRYPDIVDRYRRELWRGMMWGSGKAVLRALDIQREFRERIQETPSPGGGNHG